MIAQSTEIVKS